MEGCLVAITNGYASLTEVKAAARISDTVDDTLLELATESASRMVDEYCERRFFTNGTETRTYTPNSYYTLDVDDIAGTAITVKTSSALDGTTFDITWAASDFQTEPTNRLSGSVAWPVTRLRAVGDYLFTPPSALGSIAPAMPATAQVTAVFGFATAVPTQVKHATVLLALRQFQRYNSPSGVIGFGDFAVRVGTRMDPDVAAILNPLRRVPVGAA
jgi:hypothetical protein